MSGLPLTADPSLHCANRRFGPDSDIDDLLDHAVGACARGWQIQRRLTSRVSGADEYPTL